ncbi:hypothetical protein METSCH_C09140 [Metschnikowia aff. pulcherrima]|uniref:Uncharacterized protein n=1 Tax=Metschnikowia aff. pulcherrima TaxID=2163413 RepID=A0A4V1AEE5_9ASCO|nr:hypothetical protein METSCH_C09140 [Metschnikowia aff. pulcherrima]
MYKESREIAFRLKIIKATFLGTVCSPYNPEVIIAKLNPSNRPNSSLQNSQGHEEHRSPTERQKYIELESTVQEKLELDPHCDSSPIKPLVKKVSDTARSATRTVHLIKHELNDLSDANEKNMKMNACSRKRTIGEADLSLKELRKKDASASNSKNKKKRKTSKREETRSRPSKRRKYTCGIRKKPGHSKSTCQKTF